MQSLRQLKLAYALMFSGIILPVVPFIAGIVAIIIDPQDRSKTSYHCNYILDTIWILAVFDILALTSAFLAAKLTGYSLFGYIAAAAAIQFFIYLYRVIPGFLRLQKDIAASAAL
ncbi:hypothetical protein [Microvirga terricola]|uniref:DUF4870 domain-containing protein n=1 Tax=Microvirga terricola TaxID=2719797 RepID=A0ABX0VB83_9HYPH|nr:hypothetical protein [Microvirga terricola]NIX76758.1 hypothetical protein [Microvirga terricola]